MKYKNTEFAKGYKCSFADFKKMFKGVIPEDEMELAYKESGYNKTAPGKAKKSTAKRAK